MITPDRADEIFNEEDRRSLSLRIAKRSNVNLVTGCIEWTGPVVGHGYGRVNYNRRTYKAHRAAWIAMHGSIPQGQVVCHRCDNPRCVNVHHLFLGSLRDNAIDMCEKGRHSNGRSSRSHCPKGHPYDSVNTYTSPQGKRHCRACMAERNRDWHRRQKEVSQ